MCLGIAGLVLVAQMAGCGGGGSDDGGEGAERPVHPSFSGVSLRVGVLSTTDPAPEAFLIAVRTQQGEWMATRQGKVEVVGIEDSAEPAPRLEAPASAGPDVLVFPADRLGDLVSAGELAPWSADQLRPLPPGGTAALSIDTREDEGPSVGSAEEDPLAFAAILPPLRDDWVRDRNRVMALPIGTSALVLVYRRDAFESDANRKAAAAAGVSLTAPESYEQLDALAKFFHGRDWNGDGRPDAGLAVALGEDAAEGVADAVFLARAASLGFHPDHFRLFTDGLTGASRVATPPFVEALEKTAALRSVGPEGAEGFDAAAARAAYREGRAALLIDRAERLGDWSDPRSPVPSAVVPLPGSSRRYDPGRDAWTDLAAEPASDSEPTPSGRSSSSSSSSSSRLNRVTFLLRGGGWLVGVRASSPSQAAAFDLAAYLASPETSLRLTSDRRTPALPVRTNQIGADRTDPRLDVRGWGRAVARTLTGERLASAPREAGSRPHMAALRRARLDVMAGRRDAKSALEEAARAWGPPTPPPSGSTTPPLTTPR
jgi:multiple sugar transport system substrate-binding protein